jgi:hypothetical protein
LNDVHGDAVGVERDQGESEEDGQRISRKTDLADFAFALELAQDRETVEDRLIARTAR